MTHITCRLTAKNRDQLQNPTLCNRVWATFTFLLGPQQQTHYMLQQQVNGTDRQTDGHIPHPYTEPRYAGSANNLFEEKPSAVLSSSSVGHVCSASIVSTTASESSDTCSSGLHLSSTTFPSPVSSESCVYVRNKYKTKHT